MLGLIILILLAFSFVSVKPFDSRSDLSPIPTFAPANESIPTYANPVTLKISNGYVVYGLAQSEAWSADACGFQSNGTEELIAQGYAKISISGGTYILVPNTPVQLFYNGNLANCYIELLNISYQQPQDTIALAVYNNNLTNKSLLNSIYQVKSSEKQVVAVPQINAVFTISTKSQLPLYMNLFVASANLTNVTALKGYLEINEFDARTYQSNNSISTNISEYYPRSYGSNVVPFIYSNNSWSKIIPYYPGNSSNSVEFAVPGEGDIGIFAITNTAQSGNTTTTPILVSRSTSNATTLPQSTVQQNASAQKTYPEFEIAIILVVLIALALGAHLISKKKRTAASR